jgi:uncharacterized protein DUF6498
MMTERPGLLVQIIRHKSAIVLIAANLVPLFGLIFAGWNAFDMVFLYWLENVVIGFFNVCKLLSWGLLATPDFKSGEAFGTTPLSWKERLLALLSMIFLGGFFVLHYGLFTFVHGVFVLNLMKFGPGSGGGPVTSPFDIASSGLDRVRGDLAIPFLSLVASHGFSFAYNFVFRREYARVHPMDLMQAPYGRVIIMHFTVIIGAFVSFLLPTLMAPVLVLIKTGVDLKLHLQEREKGVIALLPLGGKRVSRRASDAQQ